MIVHKIAVNATDAEFVCKAWNVPNCRSLICKVREVWKGKKRLSCMKRYFVSSLDASQVSAERFLELSCGHWQIENRLHLIKDRWREEDKHVLFRPGLGEMWAALTDLALLVLWTCGEKGKTITKKAMAVAMKPIECLKNLGY